VSAFARAGEDADAGAADRVDPHKATKEVEMLVSVKRLAQVAAVVMLLVSAEEHAPSAWKREVAARVDRVLMPGPSESCEVRRQDQRP